MLEVRRLRKKKGWNQTELAFHAGLAPSVISQIENGKRNPSARTLDKLARALEVDVSDLFSKAEAPLPFEEAEQKERRSPFLEAWTHHMRRWAKKRERTLEEDLEEGADALLKNSSSRIFLQNSCDGVLWEFTRIMEPFLEAVRQHEYLNNMGELPEISSAQKEEILDTNSTILEVTLKWLTLAKAILNAAAEELEPDELTLYRNRYGRAERKVKEYQKAVAQCEERLSA